MVVLTYFYDFFNTLISFIFPQKIGNENITKLLIENESDINALDKSGESALHIAAENGNFYTNSSE